MTMRVGIAGMGFGATVHLRAAQSLGFDIVALADNGSGRATTLVEHLGAGVRAYSEADRMVEAENIDAVILATPPSTQARLVERALQAGKHVLCEKPVGLESGAAPRLAKLAAACGRAAGVAFEFRYDVGIVGLKGLLDEGLIGEIHRIDVDWLTGGALNPDRPFTWRDRADEGGGVLIDWGSHVLDYLGFLGLPAPHCLSASAGTRMVRRRGAAGVFHPVSAPDTCEFTLAGGAVIARIAISTATTPALGHRIEVRGSRGRALLHHAPPFDAQSRRLEFAGPDGQLQPRRLPERDEFDDERVAGMRALYIDFVYAVAGKASRLPTLGDAARVWSLQDEIHTMIAAHGRAR